MMVSVVGLFASCMHLKNVNISPCKSQFMPVPIHIFRSLFTRAVF